MLSLQQWSLGTITAGKVEWQTYEQMATRMSWAPPRDTAETAGQGHTDISGRSAHCMSAAAQQPSST